MSFHFCAHAWEVRDLDDGTFVKLRNRDLDRENVAVLVDELFVLVDESGKPNLYLDFGDIGMVSSLVIGKLIALHTRLDRHRGRLILLNPSSVFHDALRVCQLNELFEVRAGDPS